MESVSQEQRDKSLFQAKLLAGALWEASAVLIDQLFEDIAGLRSLAPITRQDIAGSFVLVATVPAPQVSNLCPGLSDWKLKALQEAATPGSTTITIAADVSRNSLTGPSFPPSASCLTPSSTLSLAFCLATGSFGSLAMETLRATSQALRGTTRAYNIGSTTSSTSHRL